MRKLAIIAIIVSLFLGVGRADADILLLGVGGAGSFVVSTTVLTNDAASLNLTDDAGANTLVAQ